MDEDKLTDMIDFLDGIENALDDLRADLNGVSSALDEAHSELCELRSIIEEQQEQLEKDDFVTLNLLLDDPPTKGKEDEE